MKKENIIAPKWLVKSVNTYNRHIEQEKKIAKKISAYLDRIDYATETGWDDKYVIKIVDGEIVERDSKKFLKAGGYALASQNGDGIYCHQVQGYESDSFSGEFYIPCEEEGKYIQVYFQM